ncbi:hypothetical protein GGS24DRAFT_491506 [Hypoxylon argillaceum]|nr:hypothetical protein GGS24DRAFT_491506 [Hypoxylon argillaceum]
MASTPSSMQRTNRPALDTQLNTALLNFASKYMKDQLEHLAQVCDQRLERELLPRLYAILRDIDHERDAFEEHKRDAARDLRDHLNLLRFDAAAIDDAIGQLHTVAPRYLDLLPSASSLALPVSGLASLSAPSTAASSDRNFDTSGAGPVSQTAATPTSTPETSSHNPQDSTTGAEPSTPATKPTILNGRVQAQAIAESSTASRSPKRPRFDLRKESETPSKRQRTTNENETIGAAQPKIGRRVAFPNLKTGECIFRHAERKGFFVVRCDYCEPGIFTEPPLLYNRALKHFQKHGEAASEEEELTNEFIFERFAFQGTMDGGEMASKYWIREHVGAMPHTFIPTGSSRTTTQADDVDNTVRKHQEIDDDFSPLSPKLRGSLRNRQSDGEEVDKNLRRTRRNVSRPDYAEIVANKDPWNTPEIEVEVSLTGRIGTIDLIKLKEVGHSH